MDASQNPTKILANTGPSGEPMATPPICLYITLPNENSTPDVTINMSFTNSVSFKDGGVMDLLWYSVVAQLSKLVS